ncbi:hypothetical protein PRUPE_7G009300 [Prunus persica]|uniref:Uncharacterized protein n=1 Tax=Prunus persica TaxID=3760 RepID=A0A251N4L4_PRUPE|nr:hypothetical protein PRUPE_7G009300 [Prunus persica]
MGGELGGPSLHHRFEPRISGGLCARDGGLTRKEITEVDDNSEFSKVILIIVSEAHCRLQYFSSVAIFVVVIVSYFIDFRIRIPPLQFRMHKHTNTQTQRTAFFLALTSELAMQFCEAFGTYFINSFYDICPKQKAFFFHES